MKFERRHVVVLLAATTVSHTATTRVLVGASAPGGGGYYGYQPQQHYPSQYGRHSQWGIPQESDQAAASTEEMESSKQHELPPLPPGWTEHFDPTSGHPYYYYAADGTTTWDRPYSEVKVVEKNYVPQEEEEERPYLEDMSVTHMGNDAEDTVNQQNDDTKEELQEDDTSGEVVGSLESRNGAEETLVDRDSVEEEPVQRIPIQQLPPGDENGYPSHREQPGTAANEKPDLQRQQETAGPDNSAYRDQRMTEYEQQPREQEPGFGRPPAFQRQPTICRPMEDEQGIQQPYRPGQNYDPSYPQPTRDESLPPQPADPRARPFNPISQQHSRQSPTRPDEQIPKDPKQPMPMHPSPLEQGLGVEKPEEDSKPREMMIRQSRNEQQGPPPAQHHQPMQRPPQQIGVQSSLPSRDDPQPGAYRGPYDGQQQITHGYGNPPTYVGSPPRGPGTGQDTTAQNHLSPFDPQSRPGQPGYRNHQRNPLSEQPRQPPPKVQQPLPVQKTAPDGQPQQLDQQKGYPQNPQNQQQPLMPQEGQRSNPYGNHGQIGPPYSQYGQPNQPPSQYGQRYAQYDQQYGQPYGNHPAQAQQIVPQDEESVGTALRGAFGSAWQGFLGFSNRTKEVVQSAKDSVVAGAYQASQSISSTSSSVLSQARDRFGSVFEGGDSNENNQYSLSGRYGVPPASSGASQRPGQQNRGLPPPGYQYPPQRPPGYGYSRQPPNVQQGQARMPPGQYPPQGRQYPPQARQRPPPQGQYPPPRQGQYPPPQGQGQHPSRGQGQHPPQGEGRQYPPPDAVYPPSNHYPPGYPGPKPREDPPHPQAQQGQRPIPDQPLQSQWQRQPGHVSSNPQQQGVHPRPANQQQRQPPPEENTQEQAKSDRDPWQHPGLGMDGF